MEKKKEEQKPQVKPKKKYNKNKDVLSLSDARKFVPEDFDDLNLNNNELRFLAGYCASGFRNAADAYRRAGYKAKSKNSQSVLANRLLSKEKIQEGIKRFLNILLAPYAKQIRYNVLDVYYKRAFYDAALFYYPDGDLIPIHNIPEDHRCCIDGITRNESYYKGEISSVKLEYKLPNRDTALSVLWKYVNEEVDFDGSDLPEEEQDRIKRIFNAGKNKPFKVIKNERSA